MLYEQIYLLVLYKTGLVKLDKFLFFLNVHLSCNLQVSMSDCNRNINKYKWISKSGNANFSALQHTVLVKYRPTSLDFRVLTQI